MRFPPPEVMASWPKANFVDPVTRGPTLLIVELTILPVAIICVILRLYVRTIMLSRTWWDDWLMVGAVIFSTGVTICVLLATQLYGWNIHIWDLKYSQMIHGRQVSIAGQTLFLFASGLTKLSILVSYLRIAPEGKTFRKAVWASIALVFTAIIVFLIVLWTQCIPSSSYWNLLAGDRDCLPEGPPLLGQVSVTIFTDFLVYVLPMPTLYHLKLPLAQRIGLMVLFGVGSIVLVAGAMRLYWVHHVVYDTYDVTWQGFYMWIWTAVETNLGVICGCVPALRPLVWRVKGRPTSYAQRRESGRVVEMVGTGRTDTTVMSKGSWGEWRSHRSSV